MNQLARIATLIQFISSMAVPFTCTNSVHSQPIACIKLIAVSTCRARYLSVCIKNSQVAAEVGALFGCLVPSSGHAKRICKILRSESWRETRFLRDYQGVLCLLNRTAPTGLQCHQEHLQLLNQVTEFLWQRVRAGFPKKFPAPAQFLDGLTLLGGAQVPEHVPGILEKGPKYSIQPSRKPHELLADVWRVLGRAAVEDKDHCTIEGVDCLLKCAASWTTATAAGSPRQVVSFFKSSDLGLLQADKEGGFVVLPSSLQKTKSDVAILKTFKPTSLGTEKVKSAALNLFKELDLGAFGSFLCCQDTQVRHVRGRDSSANSY